MGNPAASLLYWISIHALHEESDLDVGGCEMSLQEFQSTLSMRRATEQFVYLRRTDKISIHALHEESDLHSSNPSPAAWNFNPRSP